MKVLKKSFQQVQRNHYTLVIMPQHAKSIKGGHKSEEDKEGCGFCTLDSELGG